MIKNRILQLENELAKRDSGLRLLNKENAIVLIKAMKDAGVPIYAFEGFIIHPPEGVQPEQKYSRDFSQYSQEDAYELCLDYFKNDTAVNVMYDMAYDRGTEKSERM